MADTEKEYQQLAPSGRCRFACDHLSQQNYKFACTGDNIEVPIARAATIPPANQDAALSTLNNKQSSNQIREAA